MDEERPICIRCPWARFPGPNEQCHVLGGLICEVDHENVGKYDECRFHDGPPDLLPGIWTS
jgi:hypothetical protein